MATLLPEHVYRVTHPSKSTIVVQAKSGNAQVLRCVLVSHEGELVGWGKRVAVGDTLGIAADGCEFEEVVE